MGASDAKLVQELKSHFENAGAIITENDKFRETYSLDFAINAIEDVHAHVNLGVHITSDLDDADQITKFGAASKKGIVLKSIYIEVHPEVADEKGSFLVAFGACLTALFDRRHTHAKALGVRINEDCSFQFFNLEDSIQRLDRLSEDEDLAIGDEMDGRIIAYFTDKGFGFVQTDDNRKFFFHIANVVDDDLRSRLPSYVLGEIIPVVFQYGGNDGKKYPKAINVSLSDEDYYYEESESY